MNYPRPSLVGPIPTWPKVCCCQCGQIYTVNEPPEGGMINGLCPNCGHGSFNTSMHVSNESAIKSVAAWDLANRGR